MHIQHHIGSYQYLLTAQQTQYRFPCTKTAYQPPYIRNILFYFFHIPINTFPTGHYALFLSFLLYQSPQFFFVTNKEHTMPYFQGNKHTNSLDYIGKKYKIQYSLEYRPYNIPQTYHTAKSYLNLPTKTCDPTYLPDTLPRPGCQPRVREPASETNVGRCIVFTGVTLQHGASKSVRPSIKKRLDLSSVYCVCKCVDYVAVCYEHMTFIWFSYLYCFIYPYVCCCHYFLYCGISQRILSLRDLIVFP